MQSTTLEVDIAKAAYPIKINVGEEQIVMPYGRLDVFSPEGSIQTFPLTEATTTVGRSSGNTIPLDNNTISRYHFSIALENGITYITDLDSVNGTFVDGVKLNGNERRQLFDGEEILIGNLRIIFHVLDDAPTVRLEPLDDTTQRVELALANFYIDLEGPPHAIAPGAHVSAELSITNTTDADERFKIDISGAPQDWIRIDRPTPLVPAQDTTFVLINFKPLRHPASTPGNYEIKVRVYPKDKPRDVLEGTFVLTVQAYGGFGIDLHKHTLNAGERFQLLLHNQGSAPLPLSLTGVDKNRALEFRLAANRVTLAPGQQRAVEGEVRPRSRSLLGKAQTHEFNLVARSHDHAAFTVAIGGNLLVRPALPNWVPVLLLGVLGMVAVVVLVGLVLLLNTPPPEPNVTGLTLNKPALARGEVLEVSWQATDVAGIRLSVNGTPVVSETNSQLTRHSVPTGELSGEVTVQIEGFNGEAADSESATVLIYEPMRVERFTVTPSQMVRYVVQGLNVEWNVPGATQTRITGLEEFTTVPVESSGPSGNFTDIPGIPRDPMVLNLIAEDDFGNVLESSLTVNVINPECTPTGDPVTIYAGPHAAHQVVGTVPSGVTFTVDARDPSGDWVRVIGLSGGLSGWVEVSRLVCDTTFTVRDLQIEPNIPPLPTATPTPSPTVTPTLTPTTLAITPTLAPLSTPSG